MKQTILFLLLGILAISALLAISFLVQKNESAVFSGQAVFSLPTDEVTKISISYGLVRTKAVLARIDGVWTMQEPYPGAMCDPDTVAKILDACSGLRVQSFLDASNNSGENYIGQSKTVTLETADVTQTCQLGMVLPTQPDEIYAISGDASFTVQSAEANAIPDDAEQLRTWRLLPVKADAINSVERREMSHPFILMNRFENAWTATQPVEFSVESEQIMQVLTEVCKTPILYYVYPKAGIEEALMPKSSLRADLSRYGLDDENAINLQFRIQGMQEPVSFRLGNFADGGTNSVYALLDKQQAVVTVPASVKTLMNTESGIFSLKNRKVFGDTETQASHFSIKNSSIEMSFIYTNGIWNLTSPFSRPADTQAVNALFKNLSQLRADCLYEISDTEKVNMQNLRSDISIGTNGKALNFSFYENAASTNRLLMKFSNKPLIFSVPEENIPQVFLTKTFDLSLLDKTVVSLPATKLHRIEVVSEKRENPIILSRKTDNSPWITERPFGTYSNEEILEAWLTAFSDLAAVRVVSIVQKREDLEQFGLMEPELSITLDINNSDIFRRTILFGNKTETNGRYIYVRGINFVYEIDASTASLFEENLINE